MSRCATGARSSAITTCPPRSYSCGVTKGSRPGSNPALEPRRTQKGESLSSADLKAASPDMALVSAIRAGDQMLLMSSGQRTARRNAWTSVLEDRRRAKDRVEAQRVLEQTLTSHS